MPPLREAKSDFPEVIVTSPMGSHGSCVNASMSSGSSEVGTVAPKLCIFEELFSTLGMEHVG